MVDCTSMSEPRKSCVLFFLNMPSRMKVGCFFDINNKGCIEGTNYLCLMFVRVHFSFMFVYGLLL